MLEAQARGLELGALEPKLGASWPRAPWMRWGLVDIRDGSFDLSRGEGASAKSTAFFGATLTTQTGFDGLLLVSADGSLEVALDGRILWSRDSDRTRGRSWDAIDLRVEPGRHTLLLGFRRRGKAWACAIRLVERSTFMAPAELRLELPGTTEVDRSRLVGTMLSFDIRPGLVPRARRVPAPHRVGGRTNPWHDLQRTALGDAGYRPVVELSYRRGAPRDADTRVTVEVMTPAGRVTRTFRAGGVSIAECASPLAVQLPELTVARDQTLGLRARVGPSASSGLLFLSPSAVSTVARAREASAEILSGGAPFLADPQVVLATLEQRVADVDRASAGPARTADGLRRAVGRLHELLQTLEQQADPLDANGVIGLSRYSDLDGRPQSMLVHVPRGYQRGTTTRYPLVLALHGYGGSPQGILRAFLDTASELPRTRVTGFVAAPNAYGNSFYRGPGEYDVLDSLRWLLRTYPIDPNRVSITGVSMGGTGAAEIALKHSELFAAAAPLCGYHSYFLRRDVAGQPLHAWEAALMRHSSPADWAENGGALPLHIAHGTEDTPLANSRVLVDRYRELGFSVRAHWPNTGHAVWKVAYEQAGLWPWLSSQRRQDVVPKVVVKTDALRYGQHRWLRITSLERPDTMGQLQAEVMAAGHIRARTDGVLGFDIARAEAPIADDQPVILDVDAERLRYEPHQAISARRVAGIWHQRASSIPGEKRAGLEGPLRDIFAGPLVFVYGTGDASTLRANREVARAWADLGPGVDIGYPVLADTELTDTTEHERAVFVVGTPRDHRVLGALLGRLPIWVEAGRVCTRQRCYSGGDVGATFIYPNPRAPDRYIAVVTAPSVAGLLRSLSLPRLLPDFVVYDEKVSVSAGQPLLGTAQVLTAGFFARDWTLP